MIEEMSFQKRATLFATLSSVAYMDKKAATREAKKLGFTTVEFYDRDGAQAYRFMSKEDLVIACRGTQPTEWNDIKADLRALPVMAETVGRVHKGFKKEVDDLWPMIKEDLERKVNKNKNVWFTGHSLGAAMTTIMASRCQDIHHNVCEVYTFGSPRVGWGKYVKSLKVTHHRFVNNNDIVTRVPLWIMGYRHHGRRHYFNRKGQLSFSDIRDRILGMWEGWKRGRIDSIADHDIGQYIVNCEDIPAHKEIRHKIGTWSKFKILNLDHFKRMG